MRIIQLLIISLLSINLYSSSCNKFEEDTFKIIKIKIKDVFNTEENQMTSLEGAPDKI